MSEAEVSLKPLLNLPETPKMGDSAEVPVKQVYHRIVAEFDSTGKWTTRFETTPDAKFPIICHRDFNRFLDSVKYFHRLYSVKFNRDSKLSRRPETTVGSEK